MARRKAPNAATLAKLADATGNGGALALRDEMFAMAGITNERLAQITRVIVEETLLAAQTAMRQQPVVVGTGRGVSEVQLVTMPDEALRQRCREALSDLIGLKPSRSQTVQTTNVLNVVIQKVEPPATFVEAKVIDT